MLQSTNFSFFLFPRLIKRCIFAVEKNLFNDTEQIFNGIEQSFNDTEPSFNDTEQFICIQIGCFKYRYSTDLST